MANCRWCDRSASLAPSGLCTNCVADPLARQGATLDGCGLPARGEPTTALPGSADKLAVLMARARRGEPLWHDADPLGETGEPQTDDGEDDARGRLDEGSQAGGGEGMGEGMGAGTMVLDRFTVELRIGAGCTAEAQRDALRRLDDSSFYTRVGPRLRATLNAAKLDDLLVVIER